MTLALTLSLLATVAAEDVFADLSGPPVLAPIQQDIEYRLGGGDVIGVQVLGEEKLTGSFAVSSGGAISYPWLGEVNVAGKTSREVAQVLTELLEADYLLSAEVFVTIELHQSQRVEVLGEVSKPGSFYLDGPATLRQVLAEAGGVKNEAVTDIQVTRGGQLIEVNYDRLTKPGGDIPILAGDQIYVSEGHAVYVLGGVNRPGAIAYREGMTLYQAISEAEGLDAYARINKVYILRNGERIEVRLKRILKGQDPDFQLQPGDQIFIDHRGGSG